MPVDPTAAPARDWNERISADCYRPNAELGNLGAMSWNLGPTLAGWLQANDPSPIAASSRATAARTAWPSPSTTRSCRSRRRPTA